MDGKPKNNNFDFHQDLIDAAAAVTKNSATKNGRFLRRTFKFLIGHQLTFCPDEDQLLIQSQ